MYLLQMMNFIEDEDQIDNMTLGTRLIQIANISRTVYSDSNKLIAQLYKEFEKVKNREIIIDQLLF